MSYGIAKFDDEERKLLNECFPEDIAWLESEKYNKLESMQWCKIDTSSLKEELYSNVDKLTEDSLLKLIDRSEELLRLQKILFDK